MGPAAVMPVHHPQSPLKCRVSSPHSPLNCRPLNCRLPLPLLQPFLHRRPGRAPSRHSVHLLRQPHHRKRQSAVKAARGTPCRLNGKSAEPGDARSSISTANQGREQVRSHSETYVVSKELNAIVQAACINSASSKAAGFSSLRKPFLQSALAVYDSPSTSKLNSITSGAIGVIEPW